MTHAALADQLCAAYEEEALLYGEVLILAEQCQRRPQDAVSSLRRIEELLAKVEDAETRLVPARTEWHAAKCRATGRLADVLDRVASLIRQVQTHVERARRDAERQRQELAPVLDAEIQHQHMRRAYADAQSATSRGAALDPGGSGHGG